MFTCSLVEEGTGAGGRPLAPDGGLSVRDLIASRACSQDVATVDDQLNKIKEQLGGVHEGIPPV